jgi:hypothetical protein
MAVPPHYDDHAQPRLGHTQCRNQVVARLDLMCGQFPLHHNSDTVVWFCKFRPNFSTEKKAEV